MLLAWPMCTSAALAQMLRPGGPLRPDSALRTLRDRGLAAEPITVVPRSGRRADGRVVYYSSLMLDVARLARIGDDDSASAAHAAASRLALHRSSRFVADWLVERGGAEPDLTRLDHDTGGALTRLATLTAAARSELRPRLGIETAIGRVTEVRGATAVLVDHAGREHLVPAAALGPKWSGAAIAVDYELIDEGAMTVWVRPAFEPQADPNDRVTGGPHILTPAERERLSRPVTAAR